MIRVKLIGGLGNQLFQYACGRALAEDLGVKLVLDITDFATYDLRLPLISQFPMSSRVVFHTNIKQTKIWDLRAKLLGHWYKEKNLRYDENVLCFNSPKTLRGYFQSERYFKRHAELIRSELEISSSKALELRAIYGSGPVAALHFRKGDYVGNSSFGECGETYYRNGMNFLRAIYPDIKFIAFTDDRNWFLSETSISEEVILASGPNLTDLDEFSLMQSCDHFVIANSSFSWWAAWLSNNASKKVIAPKPWFDDQKYDVSTMTPVDWYEFPKAG